jgi:UDP-glucuronate decarboxylase
MRATPTVKRVLVTGGAGFLGSHLCERLLRDGIAVICLDDFSTGFRPNIAHLSGCERFSLIAHDIIEPIDLTVSHICNLACAASPTQYQRDPFKTIKSCVHGVLNLLELARSTRARFLQASTSEVYGDPEVHPQEEVYFGRVNPIGPRACYDEGKRCAETLCFDFHRQYRVAVKVARIFNTYGPRMHPDDGRVIPTFIRQALNDEPLTIYGSGEQTRSFCYVDDLIDGLVRLMDSSESFIGPVNIGNPEEMTIGELADQVIDLTGSRSTVRRMRAAKDDPQRRRPDIKSARNHLGWRPTVSLRDGLISTIAYFDRTLSCSAHGSFARKHQIQNVSTSRVNGSDVRGGPADISR